jgi:hypothetical protein
VVYIIVDAFNITFNGVISALGKTDNLVDSSVMIFVGTETKVEVVL